MADFPRAAIDIQINTLGAESNIHSAEDVQAYLEAILKKYKLDASNYPGLSALNLRIVRAEYAAVQDPDRQIPERLIAETFNQMMNEWNAPQWTRISVDELHAFRAINALVFYPAVVSRSASGDLSPTCRPVEALYVVYLLQSHGGVPIELREKVKGGLGATPSAARSQQSNPKNCNLQPVALKRQGASANTSRLGPHTSKPT